MVRSVQDQLEATVAWGHLGFSLSYVAVALSSEDGERRVVLCANGNLVEPRAIEALWDAAGRLAWTLYCD